MVVVCVDLYRYIFDTMILNLLNVGPVDICLFYFSNDKIALGCSDKVWDSLRKSFPYSTEIQTSVRRTKSQRTTNSAALSQTENDRFPTLVLMVL
jgi:hypothetical protein